MVLIDLRKAFDLVNHDLILLKLNVYGCHGNELAWSTSSLNERYQCVKYNSVLSTGNATLEIPVNIPTLKTPRHVKIIQDPALLHLMSRNYC